MRQRVAKIARDYNCVNIAEIGIFEGSLSSRLADLDNLESLFLIDPHSFEYTLFEWKGETYECRMGHKETITQETLDNIHRNVVMKFIDNSKVVVMRMLSREAAKYIKDDSLDMVFIDAIHLYEYAKQDIALWLPKIRKGGVISGDDYTPRFEGVQRAVDELGGCTVRGHVWWKQV